MEKKDFLYIPKKLKVGFNNRTFHGNDWENNRQKANAETKLAYIIYWDEKGVLRKEKSWQDWRDPELGELELANEPLHGFTIHLVRNGYRGEWFAGRDAKVLIRHPEGFVFEITPENACSLIIEGGVEAGSGIIGGEQVLAWDGKELILLGTKSREYAESSAHTKKVDAGGIKDSELIPGHIYRCRNGELRLYFGKVDFYTADFKHSNNDLSKDGWLLPNPFRTTCEKCWKRNVLHHGEHVYTIVYAGKTPTADYSLHSQKSMRKNPVDDLGEYKEWRNLLEACLNHVQWHGETYLDPVVEYRQVELEREEFAEHLKAYAAKHAKDSRLDRFFLYSKSLGRAVDVPLPNFPQNVERLLRGESLVSWNWDFRKDGLSLDSIMRVYKPLKVESVTKTGRVVEWSSYLQRKDYSYTMGAEDYAGDAIHRAEEPSPFPPVEDS